MHATEEAVAGIDRMVVGRLTEEQCFQPNIGEERPPELVYALGGLTRRNRFTHRWGHIGRIFIDRGWVDRRWVVKLVLAVDDPIAVFEVCLLYTSPSPRDS